MKHVFSCLLLVALAATSAADPVSLDYRATDASCVDASRFADEVSAKLGFVPWSATASAKIRVRVEKDGDHFTGSLLNVDRTSKIVDGATCAQVTSSLAVTVAGAVDPSVLGAGNLATRPAAPAPAAPDDDKIDVQFVAVDGRRVDISLQTGGGYGVASNGARVATSFYDKLCTTPCTARLPRGRQYLVFSEPETGTSGGAALLFDAPAKVTLQHKSRRRLRYGLLFGGLGVAAASIVGGTAIGLDKGGMLVLGLGTSLGLSGAMLPLWIHDTFTASHAP